MDIRYLLTAVGKIFPSLLTITIKWHENTGLQTLRSYTSLPYPPYTIQSPLTNSKKKIMFESDVCTNHRGLKTTLKQDNL